MTDHINDGGPAFPVSTQAGRDYVPDNQYGHQDSNTTWQFPGMTVRDYFAACALPALLTEVYSWGEQIEGGVANVAAPIAYAVADAMLKARQS